MDNRYKKYTEKLEAGSLEELNQRLLQAEGTYDFFLFDLFDTLITRTVHPEYVKMLAAKRLALYMGYMLHPEEIYTLRSKLEAEICLKNKSAGFDLEFNFDQLSQRIFSEIKGHTGIRDNYETFHSIFIAAEMECEKFVQKLDNEMLDIVRHAKRRGHLTGCVSDFYLGKEIISKFLDFHGIAGIFDYVYVSCDSLACKRSGKLYDILLAETGKKPSDILMIGDHRLSDNEVPLSKGINSFFINRENGKKEYELFLKKALNKRNLLKNLELLLKEGYQKDGTLLFQNMVFPFLLFIQRLHSRLMDEGIRDVFFISKEGSFLKNLFEIYQDHFAFNNLLRINTHYLIASRRSTFLPSLGPLPSEKFETLFRQYKDISPFDFLTNLNFSVEEIDLLSIHNVIMQEAITDFRKSPFLLELKNNIIFGEIYEKRRAEQKARFIKYLESFGVDYSNDGLCVVDVGWKGTTQDNIYRILGKGTKVKGFYLGLTGNVSREPGNSKEGLLFDTSSKTGLIFRESTTLFEVILGAPHGSAKEYSESGAITDDNEREAELFEKLTGPIQAGIKINFKAVCVYFQKSHFSYEDFIYFFKKRFAKMVLMPRKEEIECFESFVHYENFGKFFKIEFTKERLPFREKIKNLARLFTSPRETLYSGRWIPATLNNLGLCYLRPVYARLRHLHLYLRGSL